MTELSKIENEQLSNLIGDVENSFGDDAEAEGFVCGYDDKSIEVTFEFADGGEDYNITVDRKTMEIIKE